MTKVRGIEGTKLPFYNFTFIYILLYIMMTDKERIEQIIQVKHLSNVEFCNQTAMSPSSLSHILSERTKPTIAILRNIVEAFPDLNPMWVLLGQGEMFKTDFTPSTTDSSADAATLQDDIDNIFTPMRNGLGAASASSRQTSTSDGQTPSNAVHQQPPVPAAPTVNIEEVVELTLSRLQKPPRKVTEVRIFFDDGTYETFSAKD